MFSSQLVVWCCRVTGRNHLYLMKEKVLGSSKQLDWAGAVSYSKVYSNITIFNMLYLSACCHVIRAGSNPFSHDSREHFSFLTIVFTVKRSRHTEGRSAEFTGDCHSWGWEGISVWEWLWKPHRYCYSRLTSEAINKTNEGEWRICECKERLALNQLFKQATKHGCQDEWWLLSYLWL